MSEVNDILSRYSRDFDWFRTREHYPVLCCARVMKGEMKVHCLTDQLKTRINSLITTGVKWTDERIV